MHVPSFYPILDAGAAARLGISAVTAAAQILDAGAQILQFRHKEFLSRAVFNELEKVAALCRAAGVPLIVNDRADLARLIGCGLHLGQDDLPPSDARAIVGIETVIGYSTHNEQQFRAALEEPIDYIALGPIFKTASKRNPDPVVGLEELRRLRPLSVRPLVAIGGITRANAASVLAAGADAVAVIGDIFSENGDIRSRIEEWLRIV